MAAALLALLLTAAPDAAPASAAAQPPPAVSSPVTVPPPAKPTAAPNPDVKLDMASSDDETAGNYVSIWPADAYSEGVNGRVLLSCLIDVHGLAETCDVVSETPKTAGLGKAALMLRPNFQVTPAKGDDGAPVARTMTIGVTFTAPTRSYDMQGARGNMIPHTFGHPFATVQAVTMLDHPVWIAAPSFDDMARAYPAKAGGAEGYAVGHCRVDPNGVLSWCVVVKETPTNEGFGAAALSLTSKFRVAADLPRPPHGEQLYVDIPIRLTPAPPEARTVMAPTWLVGFDPDKAPKLFPPDAAAKGVTSGRGVARCTVGADGGLVDCAPDPDSPADPGFSDAAARLASSLKMNLWSADGAPVAGGVVRIPIRLDLKPAPPGAPA